MASQVHSLVRVAEIHIRIPLTFLTLNRYSVPKEYFLCGRLTNSHRNINSLYPTFVNVDINMYFEKLDLITGGVK